MIFRIKQASDCRSIFKRFWPDRFRQKGNCFCPFHDDSTPSLQVSRDFAFCHAENKKFDAIDLFALANALPAKEAIERMAKELGLTGKPGNGLGKIAAVYDYVDPGGKLLYQSVRFEPKTFRLRRRSGGGSNAGWAWDLRGIKRVPYRLPEVIAAGTVFVVEGEKDADRLAALGLAATTNSEGAGKWRSELSPFFADKNVVILPDNDGPGKSHALDVAQKLADAGAASIRILELPGLAEKGDVSDWLSKGGGTKDRLLELVSKAALFTPLGNSPAHADSGVFLTEDRIALVFAKKYADELRYCHHCGSWFRWDSTRWMREETALAFDWARSLCRKMNGPLSRRGASGSASSSAIIARATTASAVERYARADRRFPVTSQIWDNDVWLLGTPSGVVDLRNGTLRPARPADYITRLASVCPANRSQAPLWIKFLNDATGGDRHLMRFLRQMSGLCLTGSIREHALFFIYGPGGNGKSVFLNTLVNILGDYARTAAMDTFTASKSDRHPTDLAMLKGARLVTASETEEGRSWAEGRIKRLTGGDRISARFMRQDFFEFQPQFKLVIIGNHKPVLKNVDEAARRRFNIIPFIQKPPSPDKLLDQKLQGEYPAILRWMIEGCLDWQENGLLKPGAVDEATRTYFEEQDTFGRWIEERCELGPGKFETAGSLYRSWADFTNANGEPSGSAKSFAGKLMQQGFESARTRIWGTSARIYRCLCLKTREENGLEAIHRRGAENGNHRAAVEDATTMKTGLSEL